jgi:hypothetical protein
MLNRLIVAFLLVAATTPAVLADATGDVKNALTNLENVKSYHMELTSDNVTVRADVVTKPTYEIHSFSGNIETYLVGNNMYFKTSGKWQKLSAGGLQNSLPSLEKMISSNRHTYVATDLGPRMAGGALLHAYRVHDATSKKVETVFLDAGGRIVRVETDKIVITLSQFDTPMTIRAPI